MTEEPQGQKDQYQEHGQPTSWTCPKCENTSFFFNRDEDACLACQITKEQNIGGGTGQGTGASPPGFPDYPGDPGFSNFGRSSPAPYFGAPSPGAAYQYYDTGTGQEYMTLHGTDYNPHGHLVPRKVAMWEFNLRQLNDTRVLEGLEQQRKALQNFLDDGYPIPKNWVKYY